MAGARRRSGRAVLSAGIFATVAFVTVATAGGTIGLGEVLPLLRQKPALADLVFSALALRDSGWAAIRIGSQQKHLGGARFGPYTFAARRRGSSGEFDLEAVICTTATFLDRDGRRTEFDAAWSVKERFDFVVLREAGAGGERACPE